MLSAHANGTMRKGGDENCDTCPFIDDFQAFYDFYGTTDYGNHWWHSAMYNKTTPFTKNRGMAYFEHFKFKTALAEAMAKGSVVLNVWMQIVRQLETAISYCNKECTVDNCNDDPVYELDQAVAYYVGSREGEDGSGDGKFMYDLADRMASNFKTNGEFNGEEEGTAFANYQAIREFKKAQIYLVNGECDKAIKPKEYIVNNMKVPLVQGLLKAAYTLQYENPVSPEESEKVSAQGATYLAALLPYVHQCSVDDGKLLHQHMHVGSSVSQLDFKAVKAALERNYKCIGIECSDVGGIWTVNGYSDGAQPCGDGGTSNVGNSGSSSSSETATSAGNNKTKQPSLMFGAAVSSELITEFMSKPANLRYRVRVHNAYDSHLLLPISSLYSDRSYSRYRVVYFPRCSNSGQKAPAEANRTSRHSQEREYRSSDRNLLKTNNKQQQRYKCSDQQQTCTGRIARV